VSLWGRMLAGGGVGIISISLPGYFAELSPKEGRATYGSSHQHGITVGIFFGVLASTAIIAENLYPRAAGPQDTHVVLKEWIAVTSIIGMLPALVAWFVFWRKFKFETPHWYLERNQRSQAKAVLGIIYKVGSVAISI